MTGANLQSQTRWARPSSGTLADRLGFASLVPRPLLRHPTDIAWMMYRVHTRPLKLIGGLAGPLRAIPVAATLRSKRRASSRSISDTQGRGNTSTTPTHLESIRRGGSSRLGPADCLVHLAAAVKPPPCSKSPPLLLSPSDLDEKEEGKSKCQKVQQVLAASSTDPARPPHVIRAEGKKHAAGWAPTKEGCGASVSHHRGGTTLYSAAVGLGPAPDTLQRMNP